MKILSSNIESSYTIKKSKFLCFGYIVKSKEEIKNIINELKKEYSDASHICYAYVLDDQTYYFTDGGEPSGTAGKPIYSAIQSFKLNYTLCVVVRYFGGIKFGPGPLRATFKDVAMQTLELSKIKNCIMADVIEVKVPYPKLKQITLTLKPYINKKTFEKEYVLISLVGSKKDILDRLDIKPISIKENQVV